MTHITEERVIGNDAGLGGSTTVATRTSLTVTDILAAGVRRRATDQEMTATQSTWDSEGGAIREGQLLPLPRGFGR